MRKLETYSDKRRYFIRRRKRGGARGSDPGSGTDNWITEEGDNWVLEENPAEVWLLEE